MNGVTIMNAYLKVMKYIATCRDSAGRFKNSKKKIISVVNTFHPMAENSLN
jgi:hypothetical protein